MVTVSHNQLQGYLLTLYFNDFSRVPPLWETGILICNYSDKVVGRLVRFFKILQENGIIVARARKIASPSLDKAK
jgi:hypothetical protein